MLGIDGSPGTGKTFGVLATLKQAGMARVSLSGADLESGEAGRPALLVRRAYLAASAAIERGKPAAVVLDDADAVLGRWDDSTTYTVNHQVTVTELMHLADSPTLVDGRRVRRVPVIITGNALARLYPPLRRPGRMQIHTWMLEPGEKLEVIQSLFQGVDADHTLAIFKTFSKHPVAFFSDLRRRAEEAQARAFVGQINPAEAVRRAMKGQLQTTSRAPISLASLQALGRRMEAEQAVQNHLGG
jgi:ATP-dependent 26S proteasome regulatory subunit